MDKRIFKKNIPYVFRTEILETIPFEGKKTTDKYLRQ